MFWFYFLQRLDEQKLDFKLWMCYELIESVISQFPHDSYNCTKENVILSIT